MAEEVKKFTDFFQIGEARAAIKKMHPWICLDKLSWQKIKDLANGDLVPVKQGSKFILMTPADVAPGGKLDKHNFETRAKNRAIRMERRYQQAKFLNENPEIAGLMRSLSMMRFK